jgi:hypothetical protein
VGARPGKEYSEIVKRSEVEELLRPPASFSHQQLPADHDEDVSCLGYYKGSFGQVFFGSGSYYTDVFEGSYLENNEVRSLRLFRVHCHSLTLITLCHSRSKTTTERGRGDTVHQRGRVHLRHNHRAVAEEPQSLRGRAHRGRDHVAAGV